VASLRASLAPPLVLAVLLIGLGGPALPQYNVTWDEASGDFFFGQRYWSYFTTLDPRYLDFRSDPYPPGFVPDLSSSPERHAPSRFYAVGGTLAAATSELLYRRLGWLDPYDGYHAVNLWLAVLFLFVFYRFLLRHFGIGVAVLAPLLLFLCPRIVCDLMANIKDFPSLVLFSVTLIAFLAAWEAGSVAGVLGSGVLWGVALGAKSNALFIAPVVGLLFLAGRLPEGWGSRYRALLAIVLAGSLGVGTWVLVWPYTWEDPARLLFEHLRFIATFQSAFMRPESTAPPLPNLLFTTPIPFLLLFGLGLWPLWQRVRRREPAALLVLIWIAVVAGRLVLPGAVNFDGVRHFLELFPPLAVVAALGLVWVVERMGRLPAGAGRKALRAAVVALPLVSMATSLVRSHPHEIAYWNALIGGLGGAQERRMAQAGDYWGASYRLGLDWLNEHAAPGSALAVPLIEHTVRLVAPERLRADLELLSVPPSSGPRAREALAWLRAEAAERDVYVLFVPRQDWMNGLMHHFLRNERPLESWDLDGVPVLLLYRFSPGEARAALSGG